MRVDGHEGIKAIREDIGDKGGQPAFISAVVPDNAGYLDSAAGLSVHDHLGAHGWLCVK